MIFEEDKNLEKVMTPIRIGSNKALDLGDRKIRQHSTRTMC